MTGREPQGAGQEALVELAAAVAREAGAQLCEAFARVDDLRIATKSTATDLVSEADLAAERLIRERLTAARPDDGMLGEEGSDVPGSSGLRWVVDPLDGTVNFLFGIPQWGVSIAVGTSKAPWPASSSTRCATTCGRPRATARHSSTATRCRGWSARTSPPRSWRRAS